jgi:hypothetical protein
MRNILIALPAALFILTLSLSACVTTPAGKQELSDSGKTALQGMAIIGVSRYIREHDNAAQRVANIRAVALEIRNVTSYTSVIELRAKLDAEIRARVKDPNDQMDALGLLLVFDPVIKELFAKGEVDPLAVIKVNEFIDFLLAALPNVPPPR